MTSVPVSACRELVCALVLLCWAEKCLLSWAVFSLPATCVLVTRADPSTQVFYLHRWASWVQRCCSAPLSSRVKLGAALTDSSSQHAVLLASAGTRLGSKGCPLPHSSWGFACQWPTGIKPSLCCPEWNYLIWWQDCAAASEDAEMSCQQSFACQGSSCLQVENSEANTMNTNS